MPLMKNALSINQIFPRKCSKSFTKRYAQKTNLIHFGQFYPDRKSSKIIPVVIKSIAKFYYKRWILCYIPVLFIMLYLSLRILFQGVSRLPGFLSNHRFLRQNSYFLRQYPVLPGVLCAVPRVVHRGGGWGGTCVS